MTEWKEFDDSYAEKIVGSWVFQLLLDGDWIVTAYNEIWDMGGSYNLLVCDMDDALIEADKLIKRVIQ